MPKPRHPRPVQAARPAAPGALSETRGGGAELERLQRERDEARALLQSLAASQGDGAEVLARRIASLEEERMVARGQAVEAVLARNRAEAALKALSDAIERAPGLQGWLLRRAKRRLSPG